MIRRLFSTFIDLPTQHLTSELFQPNQKANFFRNELCNLDFLFDCAPCFTVNANRIRIISEPKDFYETLLKHAGRATERISLASLYLGELTSLPRSSEDDKGNSRHWTDGE
jgi:phosphatidylserine/phosphatidylglycerophosphate/cardiolipin synthase-like enzyme